MELSNLRLCFESTKLSQEKGHCNITKNNDDISNIRH